MKQAWLAIGIGLHVALMAAAQAEQSVRRIQTTGVAQMNRASDAMIATATDDPGISVRLPEIVSQGEVIAIQYEGSGSTVSDSFMVTDIVVTNGDCILRSKHPLAKVKLPIDTIRVRPCRQLE